MPHNGPYVKCPQCGAHDEGRCVAGPAEPCLLAIVREARLSLVPTSALWDNEPAGPLDADIDSYWAGWRDATDAVREAALGSKTDPNPAP